MKKAIFIYNPLSGDHSVPLKINHILGRFQDRDILLQPYRVSGADQTEKLREILLREHFDFIVISGGDGTLNNITNIILKHKLELPVGIIPSGTCNDFARSLNIPSTLDECLDIILEGKTTPVDVGFINEGQYFLGTCAGGFFVDVSYNTHHELKRNFGPFAYYLKALSEVANIRSFNLKLKTENEYIETKVLLFLILNGKNAGGFADLVKGADISDGLMDIVLIKDCSHIDLASLFFKVLSQDALYDKNVTILKAEECIVESSDNIFISIDGEKGDGLPMSIKFINKALNVFIP